MRESFPTLFEHSFNQSHFFWRVPYKLESRGFSELVLYHFETELESAAGNLELMTERTSSFVTDLIKQKQVYPRSIILLDYLQFTACGSILSYFSKNKYFNYCFDWILNSLSNEVSTEIKRDFQPYKLIEFIESRHPFIIETIDQILPTWIHDLFYYARHSGGNKELSEFCLTELLPWLLQTAQRIRSLEYVMALSQISTWCFNFKYDDKNRQVQKAMEAIYETSEDINIRKIIAFHFSCLQENETARSRNVWTDIVLSTYSHLLVEHEQFQVLANRWEDNIDHILVHFDDIVFAIKSYTANQRPFHGVLFNHIRSTLFTILHRMVAMLLTHGHVSLTNRLYGAFFGIDDHRLIAPINLYIVPGLLEEGTLFVSDGKARISYLDSDKILNETIRLHNAFASNSFTRHDDMNFIPEAPERQGVPTRNNAEPYEIGLRHLLEINQVLLDDLSQYNGYYLLLGMQLPIQSILSIDTGVTIPQIHSFCNPLRARKIRKIFIWQGYTQTAEYERLGLEEIFRTSGCEVIFCNCFESGKETFVNHYSNPEYDLIWILGHGEFLHQSAHTSYLDLGNEIQVSIDELIAIPMNHTDRRLLLIDACDGANSALANSPAAIGIGVSVVGESQSVMSHNWPVENVSSLILGLLVASALATGMDYAGAHHNAIGKFREGRSAILEYLDKFIKSHEVLERIQHSEIDYSNFYYWGSLSYII